MVDKTRWLLKSRCRMLRTVAKKATEMSVRHFASATQGKQLGIGMKVGPEMLRHRS